MPFQLLPVRKPALAALCLALGLVLYLRSPFTNFVFDEQEALLANPFVNGNQPLHHAFQLDFWGRGPGETIGSYRPLPNLVWRLFAFTLRSGSPLYLQLINIVLHAWLACLLGLLSFRVSGDRVVGWVAALTMATLGLATEAVCGVVGLADILAGLASVLMLGATLSARPAPRCLLVLWVFLGLLAKETLVSVLPLVPLFALLFARHARPFRRVVEVLASEILAVGLYILLRYQLFPFQASLTLPIDAVNNPLRGATLIERIPTALAIFGRGAGQLVAPFGLSGDYSFAESAPEGWSLAAILGALVWGASLVAGGSLLLAARARASGRAHGLALLGFGVLWVPVVQFPVSNVLVLLPTIRADRLWYLPALGFCLIVAQLAGWALTAPRRRGVALALLGFFLALQAISSRSHAFDYSNDLSFWRATARAAPRSAKARLNLGVMLGARGQTEARVALTRQAVELAPDWPMGHIYLGDALCRRKRLDEAWPSYARGLELAPEQRSLVALALQCLWDQGAFQKHEAELEQMRENHPGSWLAYLVRELSLHGSENGGVPATYRPRAYNEKVQGP